MKRLTKAVVEAAPIPERSGDETDEAYGKRSKWLGDSEVRGFGVKVYASGRRVYALGYRTARGRSRMLTIGQHGELTLKQARDRARAEKVRILDGEDPQGSSAGPSRSAPCRCS